MLTPCPLPKPGPRGGAEVCASETAQGVPGPCRGSPLITLSDALWLKQCLIFTVSPTIFKGNHLLDICTWARVPLRGCKGILPFEGPGVPPSLWRLPWLVGSSGNENGHIVSWWPALGGSVLGLLLHSFILPACRHPGLIKRKQESVPLLLDRDTPERKRWAPTCGQWGAGSEQGVRG